MTCLKKLKKFILSLFLISSIILLLLSSTQAIDLYADVEIKVDNAGFVSIEGNTNYQDLIVENSEEYTSKSKSLWTLNITKNVTFTDFVFSILLPEKTEILSLNSTGSTLISEQSGNLIIKGHGTNETISIILQYQTDKVLETVGIYDLDFLSLVLILCNIVLIICLIIVLFYVDKKEKPLTSNNNENTFSLELKGLNDRQKKILKLLEENNVPLTQTDIQRELELPKASVSRNIRRLEIKGLIEKEQIGMSNIIRLKKQ